jgi:ATP-dependent exoDNAse (exonuclease V) beta subunit
MEPHNNLSLTPDGKFYTDGRTEYQRVTSYLKDRILPAFDAEAKAKQMAGKGKYALYTPADVMDEWQRKSNEATTKGTQVHEFIEAVLTNGFTVAGLPEPFVNKLGQFLRTLLTNCAKHGFEHRCEVKLKSDELLIAGTTDLFLTDGTSLIVRDWKTNKERPAPEAPTYNKYLKYPYHLPCNDHAKHTAQLNIYTRMIIEGFGLKPQRVDLGIYWVDSVGNVELIRSPYLPEQTAKLETAKIF